MRNKIKAAMSRYFHQLPGVPNGPAPSFDDELPPFVVVPVWLGDADPLGDGDVVFNGDPDDVGEGDGELPSVGDADGLGDDDDVGVAVDDGDGPGRGVGAGVGPPGVGRGVGDPCTAMTAGALVAFALWPRSDCVTSTRAR